MSSPFDDPTRSDHDPVAGSHRVPDTEAETRARTESLGEMFSSLTDHLTTLVRQEIQLARVEATDTAKKAGVGAGMYAGAVIAGFFVLLFLSLALMWVLGSYVHWGWAALIVAGVWAIITAVLAVIGKNRFNQMKGLPQTQETVQEIPPTLNPSKETP